MDKILQVNLLTHVIRNLATQTSLDVIVWTKVPLVQRTPAALWASVEANDKYVWT